MATFRSNCRDCTLQDIINKVKFNKIIAVTRDGASNMVANKNGLISYLTESILHPILVLTPTSSLCKIWFEDIFNTAIIGRVL